MDNFYIQSPWRVIVKDWDIWNKNKKKGFKQKMKDFYKVNSTNSHFEMIQAYEHSLIAKEKSKMYNSAIPWMQYLGCNNAVPATPMAIDVPCKAATTAKVLKTAIKRKEEENNMYNIVTAATAPARNIEAEQRDYLKTRATNVFFKLYQDIPEQFGLRDEEIPNTRRELAKRLKEGRFVIQGFDPEKEDDYDDEELYNSPLRYIRWRDPAVKADPEGADKARAALDVKNTEIKDIIAIKPVEDGLKAVQEFEAYKVH